MALARFLVLDPACHSFHPLRFCPRIDNNGVYPSNCSGPTALAPLTALLESSQPVTSNAVRLALERATQSAGYAADHGCPQDMNSAETISVVKPLIAGNDSLPEVDPVSRLCLMLTRLHAALRERRQLDVPAESTLRVVVGGGGPVGLMNAIIAHESGGRVQVLEKRTSYNRDVWFDLEPRPWGVGVELLVNWGADATFFERITHAQNVLSVRTQVLERFLALVATVLGIPIRYGREVVGLCATDSVAPTNPSFCQSQSVAVRLSPSGSARVSPPTPRRDWDCAAVEVGDRVSGVPFDLLVGAGGHKCQVRSALELADDSSASAGQTTFPPVSYKDQTSFRVKASGRMVSVENLHQTTLIIFFNANSTTGECPPLETAPDGLPLSPLWTGFALPGMGVTSAWKRFYMGYCSLQVLFTHEVGAELMARFRATAPARNSTGDLDGDTQWQNDAYPWDDLLSIWNTLITSKLSTVEKLQAQVLRRAENPGLFAIELFDVIIRAATPTVVAASSDSAVCPLPSTIMLAGDAAITPHYRLGVGINNAFAGLEDSRTLLKKLGNAKNGDTSLSAKVAEQAVREAQLHFQKRFARMGQFQLSTMFFEAYCDLVVDYDMDAMGEDSDPRAFSFWDTQQLLVKNMRTGAVTPIEGDPESYCDTLLDMVPS